MALADLVKAQIAGTDGAVVKVDAATVSGCPDDAPIAASGTNRVLEGVTFGQRPVHLCFGNNCGQTIQKGTYAKLVSFLNALKADHAVLEMARHPLEILRDVES
jgi:5-methyltetrahydropteroyltriglutamate--homocysteine methyltransferase